MSKASWVLFCRLLLLAAITAACLRLGSAEGDPIPPSLVDLLKNSPISSVEDLKQLLQQEPDSIEEEEEEEEHDILVNHTHGRYTRSLVEAQPAQQAVCKVRTEVMEVTRAMLDRRNANFLLWPPCVEVQRCSGCCNTRTLQCVPTLTSTRYLQVIKIQYINKNAHYEKAIIPVEDHAGCRCQSSSSSSAAASPRSNPPPPPPPQPQQPPSPPTSSPLRTPLHHQHHHQPAPPPQKSHGAAAAAASSSKADLHRHDDLKRNQQGYRNHHHEERRGGEWQQQPVGAGSRYTQLAHTQPQPHWTTQPRTPPHHPSTHGLTHPWSSGVRADQAVATQEPPAAPRGGEGQGHGHGSGYDGSKEDGGVAAHVGTAEQRHLEHTQRQQQLYQQQQQQQQQQQYEQQKQQQQQQHYQQQQYQYRQHYTHQAYPQYNRGVGDRELRTQYRLNGPQSDSASSPPAGGDAPAATRSPNHDNNKPQQRTASAAASPSPEQTNQRGGLSSDTNQTRTETKVAANHESGKEREEAGSANSGDAAVAATELPANQKRDKDSETSGGAERPLTELERRQKLLEIVQREPHLHPHHPQQRPKPEAETTSHKSVVPTTADPSSRPSSSSGRLLPFRPALPRRRRKHRSRISKAAIRAMIM